VMEEDNTVVEFESEINSQCPSPGACSRGGHDFWTKLSLVNLKDSVPVCP
jgi:hypothetical protein